LNSAFEVRGIPSVIVVDTSGGVVTRDGRSEIMQNGVSAFQSWHNQVEGIVLLFFKSVGGVEWYKPMLDDI